MNLLHVSNNSFEEEVLKSSKPVIVDFYADWCGPCKMLSPVVDELSKKFESTLKVVKLNVDDSYEITTQYSVSSVPTLILFENGKEKNRIVGYKSTQELISIFGL